MRCATTAHRTARCATSMPTVKARPVNAEAAADVKRIYGDCALLRLMWTGEASTVFHVLIDGAVAAYLKVGANLAPERDRLEDQSLVALRDRRSTDNRYRR